MRFVLGARLDVGPVLDTGRVEVELRGHSIASLAAEIAGLGARLLVTEPPELRRELARIGTELAASYPG